MKRDLPLIYAATAWVVAGISVAVAIAVAIHALVPGPPRRQPQPLAADRNGLVRWHDADRDWLLVVDRPTGELVVYDATDGRPLYRFGSRQGLAKVQGLVREGPWLFVLGDVRHPLWRLPELRPVEFAGR